jgi:ribosomal protein L11 methylase PrmA
MVVSDDSYNYFGKYFTTYLDYGTQRFYIASYRRDSHSRVHGIEEVVMCNNQQYYNVGSNSCVTINDGSDFGLGFQNTTRLTCSRYDETDDYVNMLGETF